MPHAQLTLALAAIALLGGCATRTPHVRPLEGTDTLLGEIYASEGYQLTGVAVSKRGRVFVNFPRWDARPGAYRMAVGEVGPDNTITPFPPGAWNGFNADPRTPPEGDRFVCVQSVHVDDRDRLWILDPASPLFAGVIRQTGGGPKLIEVDLARNTVARVIRFDDAVAPVNSYLNDVRIETSDAGDTAYITDSGAGAIVVVDLTTGRARRLLADHPSTKADPNFVPVIGGRKLRGGDGQVPQVHSDGLALDTRPERTPADFRSGGWLYWQALTGKRLYRAPIRLLKDADLPPADLAAAVQDLGETVMTDGMDCDADGVLFFSALEQDAIVVRLPDGSLHTLVRDPLIAWPDSFALAEGRMPDGVGREPLAVFTTAQIHRTPMFNPGSPGPTEPYRVLATPAPRKKRP